MNTLLRVTLSLACITAINLGSSIGSLANADVLTDWNNAALDAIRAENTSPPIASRSLAILHASIYDAVNGIARTHAPYLVQNAVSSSASSEAAASAAAHDTLVNLFPARTSTFDALHAAILATIPDGPHKAAGIAWGEFVATKSSRRAPTMVPMQSSRRLAAAVPACGCRRLRVSFLICCRSGDSSSRLQ